MSDFLNKLKAAVKREPEAVNVVSSIHAQALAVQVIGAIKKGEKIDVAMSQAQACSCNGLTLRFGGTSHFMHHPEAAEFSKVFPTMFACLGSDEYTDDQGIAIARKYANEFSKVQMISGVISNLLTFNSMHGRTKLEPAAEQLAILNACGAYFNRMLKDDADGEDAKIERDLEARASAAYLEYHGKLKPITDLASVTDQHIDTMKDALIMLANSGGSGRCLMIGFVTEEGKTIMLEDGSDDHFDKHVGVVFIATNLDTGVTSPVAVFHYGDGLTALVEKAEKAIVDADKFVPFMNGPLNTMRTVGANMTTKPQSASAWRKVMAEALSDVMQMVTPSDIAERQAQGVKPSTLH
jgi:hypothetical protein